MTSSESPQYIYDLNLDDLRCIFSEWGEAAYRALQVWQGLYQNLWTSATQFTPLSQSLRNRLAESFTFNRLVPDLELASTDGETRKTLFRLPDGGGVEAVLMMYERRRTLCISTQVGCAMGCVFCATGQMGFQRNLSSGEIVEQVLNLMRPLRQAGENVSNIVIMGMGEPFHNYDALMAAVERLNHPQGVNFGARRFTISTVGLVPGIRRFTAEKNQVNLAVSLHAAENDLRQSLLPVAKKYPLPELMEACQEYVHLTRRRLTFEWALIRGVNDGEYQARKLAALLQPFIIAGSALCHVNIIPLNETQKYPGQPTTRQNALHFQAVLEEGGIPCTIRLRRGLDINAGCGQLASREINRSR